MKLGIFIFTIFTINAFACMNYIPVSDAEKAIALDGTAGKVKCSDVPSEQCLCYDNVVWEYYDLVDNMVDDVLQPTFSKSETESCVDIADCDAKHTAKVCADAGESPIKNYDTLEVYCSKPTGYVKIVQGKKFELNQAKKDAFDANEAAKAAQNAAFELAEKSMACGKKVQQLLLIRNSAKSLTTTQVKSLVLTYADIKRLLDSGSLESAKEEIQAATADGILVTEDDKTALVAQLDACKP